MSGFSGEFIPPGHMTEDMKPAANNMAEMFAAHAEESGNPIVSNARPLATVHPIRPQQARTNTNQSPIDPVSLIADRVAFLELEVAKLEGFKTELRKLKKALVAYGK